MIFLSNRKLKLIIITLLLLIFCFFLGMFRPKALTSAEFTNEGSVINDSFNPGTTANQYRFPSSTGYKNIFEGYGEGTIMFTFQTSSYDSSLASQISSVETIANNGNRGLCDIGTVQAYLDSNTQIIIFSAKCPVNLPSGVSLSQLYFKRGGGAGKLDLQIGSLIAFVSKDSGANNTSVIQADLSTIQQYQIDINNNISQFKNATHQDLEDLKTALRNNNTAITNIQNNTQNINDSINDDSIDSSNATSSASSWTSKNASNGTITQLLTLPITLLQAIVNGISTSCSNFSLGSLFGTNITLPCINLSNLIGSGLYTTIDILFSGFMILAIGKKLIKIFNDFTNLKSNQIDELYGGGK